MIDISKHLEEIEKQVLDELKDFQKATVERIDYLFRHNQNRVLVSDEVGLGKTLVARGTIAKFANLRKDEGDNLVKVVYICSNAAIAEQNLDKLRITNDIQLESVNTSRLSMQHLNIFNQENDANIINRYIQIIPLTPETSFKITNSQGTVDERALMYVFLRRIPELKKYDELVNNMLKFNVKYWNHYVDKYEQQIIECDKKSDHTYIKYMLGKISSKLDIDSLLSVLVNDDKYKHKKAIVNLRIMFSEISLNKLEPDLVIMDEFQRFKYLLSNDENSDMNRIVNKFFSLDDVRILMLSATPYKMYSTLDEIDYTDVDAHFQEFFDVVNFLNRHENMDNFKKIWNDYSVELKEANLNNTSFIIAKNKAQGLLYNSICRTERISENQLTELIHDEDISLNITDSDIVSYMEVQKLLDDFDLNINIPVDYVKSSPYLLSFAKNYHFKRKIQKYFKKNIHQIDKVNGETLFLDTDKISDYEKISYNNARLECLMKYVLKDNASNLLWIPPSKPYYEPAGAFKDIRNFTKTLIFSSWEMVPRMISSMVSYEIERQTIGCLDNHSSYFAEKRYPYPRMRFALKNEVPSQMPLFTLIYPSKFLSDVYSPIDCLNKKLTLEEIENEIKAEIINELDKIPYDDSTIHEDYRWYYLVPILLDSDEYAEAWFSEVEKLIESRYFYRKGFLKHFYTLKEQYYSDTPELGRKPDDLVDVLCDMAIASPAVCTTRSYEKESKIFSSAMPTQIGRKFIDRMNLAESIAVIDLNSKSNSEDAYWKNVLKYSKDGNLQSVFDEYVHLMANGLNKNDNKKIDIINNRFLKSFDFRTTSYEIDTYDTFKAGISNEDYSNYSMRSHFAVSFTKGKSDDKDTNRKKSIQDAFNSPFRPFVLASTSIGQEGLDFHNYCRRIVHWNLPSNPIDLEQREGRINRFESLAIRQNVAKRYGDIKFESDDIWSELFINAGKKEKTAGCSDLIPYWGLKESEDMIKIERIVPNYPFSRDEVKYNRLIKILSLYRLTLGQTRQEELLDLIFNRYDVHNMNFKNYFINLSPFYK